MRYFFSDLRVWAVSRSLVAAVKVEGAVEATTTVSDSRSVVGVTSVGTWRVSPSRLGEVLLEDVEDRVEGITDACLPCHRL